jgi:hypothetical protein
VFTVKQNNIIYVSDLHDVCWDVKNGKCIPISVAMSVWFGRISEWWAKKEIH